MHNIKFSEIPLFKGLDRIELARLVPVLEKVEFKSGDVLFRKGEPADCMYVIIDGKAGVFLNDRAGGQEIARLDRHDCIGEMALLSGEPRSADVMALTDLKTLKLSKKSFDQLVEKHKSFALYFSALLAKKLYNLNCVSAFGKEEGLPDADVTVDDGVFAPEAEKRARKKTSKKESVRIAGWLLAVIVPGLVLYFGPQMGLAKNAAIFLSIFSASVIMWIFKLVDEYVPGLFAMMTILSMELVPSNVILSGFVSDGFFMAMSVLGLGAVIVTSGLSYRLILMLLLRLPNSQFWFDATLLFSGFFLTPLLPTANGRVALIQPVMNDMAETLHLKKEGISATKLSVAAFSGASLMSGVFLTSKSVNFVVYGMLSAQVQDQFQWLSWFFAAAVPGAVMLLLYSIGVSAAFRNGEVPRLSREQVRTQIELLGPVTRREWAAIFAISAFVIGILTYSFHKVLPSWQGLALLYGLLLFGFLPKKEFREKIDWPFLIYTASLIGIVGAFNTVGLNKTLVGALSSLGESMHSNFGLFILALAVIIFVMRLFVPINATIIIVATVFIPVAEIAGINPWVMGFIILMLGEMWIMPYQCSYYLQFRDVNTKKRVYNEKTFLRFNIYMNIVRVTAIYASIPYWQMLGLL